MTNDVKPVDGAKTLTAEMIAKLKKQLDDMEGQEIKDGGPVQIKPGDSTVAWYIAYKTASI